MLKCVWLWSVWGLILLIGACGYQEPTFPSAVRTTAPPIPEYPRMLQAPTVTETMVQTPAWSMPQRFITFHTSDLPNDVYGFYKAQLVPQGWVISYESASGLILSRIEACPYYSLTVIATRRGTPTTSVEMDYEPGICDFGLE